MSTEHDTSPAAESADIEQDQQATDLHLVMDIDVIDAAGVAMMTAAAALRREVAAADEQISALLDGWTDPSAATIAADWDTAHTAAGRWLDHMHGLGSLSREAAASMQETEAAAAAEFRRRGRECVQIAERFRRISEGRAADSDPDATDTADDGTPA